MKNNWFYKVFGLWKQELLKIHWFYNVFGFPKGRAPKRFGAIWGSLGQSGTVWEQFGSNFGNNYIAYKLRFQSPRGWRLAAGGWRLEPGGLERRRRRLLTAPAPAGGGS